MKISHISQSVHEMLAYTVNGKTSITENRKLVAKTPISYEQ